MSAWQNATCDEGQVSGSRWRRGGGWGNVTDVTDLRGRHTKWKAFRSLEKQSSQIYFFSLWQWIIIESGHIKCILRVFQGNRESSSSVFWVIFCVEFPHFRVGSIFCRLKLEVGESHLDRFNVQCQEILKTVEWWQRCFKNSGRPGLLQGRSSHRSQYNRPAKTRRNPCPTWEYHQVPSTNAKYYHLPPKCKI